MLTGDKTRITISEGGQDVTFKISEFRDWLAKGRAARSETAADVTLVDALREAWDDWHNQPGSSGLPADRLLEALAARAQEWGRAQ
ncbi:hypothetical protein [Hyphomonas sp. UBA4494]|jgi:hypothetical protein|uniref:hypothetical protein n=1 Tax=Hyphomonas sp. UBA4494 TaxID=1946631 RepID=UPI0025B881FD|nr:hypothetical protein [Hyphomonas sp. UBA4494]